MTLFYAETGFGCTLVVAPDKEVARAKLLREVGSVAGVQLVREAKQEDVQWIKAMGGYVPDVTKGVLK